ncbi:MAG: DUF5591 domain-containing protein [Candidatus Altiarchaeota archaeon]|nr:DUF5591 domain-containing protein [Candidatus Altiarchaeota archaeon]
MEKFMVLESGKCSWGSCVFCGWGKKATDTKGLEQLKQEFDSKLGRAIKAEIPKRIKLFTSGSMLDEQQYPTEFVSYVVSELDKTGIAEFVLETNVLDISQEKLDSLNKHKGKLKILFGIGLEVADDDVLKKLGKQSTVQNFTDKAELIKQNGFGIRAYVLVNPPFCEPASCLDKTMEFALECCEEIVMINTYPHRDAPLFDLWVQGKWRPADQAEFDKLTSKWLKHKQVETDFANYKFVPKFPRRLMTKIIGANHDCLVHPYYQVWQDFLQRFYEPRPEKNILLFIPCAFRKPYKKSRTHRAIFRAIKDLQSYKQIHPIVVSSPGVIPVEFQSYYPFANYDWPEWEETAETKQEYTSVNKERVKLFLKKHASHYKQIFVYFKHTSETRQAIIAALDELGLEYNECLSKQGWETIKDEKNPIIHETALAELRDCLAKAQ